MRPQRWAPYLFAGLGFIVIFDRISIHPEFPVSLYKILQLPMLVAMAAYLFTRPWAQLNLKTPITLGLISLVGVATLAALLSDHRWSALVEAARLLQFALFGYLVFLFLREDPQKDEWHSLSFALALAGVAGSLTLISDFLGWTHFYLRFEQEVICVRQVGLFGEPNYAAVKLGLLLPFCCHVTASYGRAERWLALVLSALGLLVVGTAVVLAASRIGTLIALITLVAFVARERAWLFRVQALGAIAVALVAFTIAARSVPGPCGLGDALWYTFGRHQLVWRFLALGEEELGIISEESLHKRLELTVVGLRMFIERPLFGFGPGTFPLEVGKYDSRFAGLYQHNTFLTVLIETGVLGFLAFAYLCYVIARQLIRSARVTTATGFNSYLLLSYVGLLLAFMLLQDLDDRVFWGIFIPIALYLEFHERKSLARAVDA